MRRGLRVRGHDAFHARELGLDRAPDVEIIKRAVSEQRTIVTADLDYPRLLGLSHAINPSVILFRGGNWSEVDVVIRMKDILGSLGADEINQSIVVVDLHSIRRRRLPI